MRVYIFLMRVSSTHIHALFRHRSCAAGARPATPVLHTCMHTYTQTHTHIHAYMHTYMHTNITPVLGPQPHRVPAEGSAQQCVCAHRQWVHCHGLALGASVRARARVRGTWRWPNPPDARLSLLWTGTTGRCPPPPRLRAIRAVRPPAIPVTVALEAEFVALSGRAQPPAGRAREAERRRPDMARHKSICARHMHSHTRAHACHHGMRAQPHTSPSSQPLVRDASVRRSGSRVREV